MSASLGGLGPACSTETAQSIPGVLSQKAEKQRKIIEFTRLPLQPVPGRGVLDSLGYETPVPHQRRLYTSITSPVPRQKPV